MPKVCASEEADHPTTQPGARPRFPHAGSPTRRSAVAAAAKPPLPGFVREWPPLPKVCAIKGDAHASPNTWGPIPHSGAAHLGRSTSRPVALLALAREQIDLGQNFGGGAKALLCNPAREVRAA